MCLHVFACVYVYVPSFENIVNGFCQVNSLELASGAKVSKGLFATRSHGLLTLANPNTRVEELLVRLVGAIGVADLAHEVVLLVQDVVADTEQVGPLRVGVDVHLDHTVADGGADLVLLGTGSAVEDEEDRVLLVALDLSADVLLVLAEQLGLQRDVSGLVDTVNVTETGGDGEVGGNLGELAVDVPDVLGLGVERGVVNTLVVNTVLFTTSNADLHLEPDAERSHALEVLEAGLDVLLLGLLG